MAATFSFSLGGNDPGCCPALYGSWYFKKENCYDTLVSVSCLCRSCRASVCPFSLSCSVASCSFISLCSTNNKSQMSNWQLDLFTYSMSEQRDQRLLTKFTCRSASVLQEKCFKKHIRYRNNANIYGLLFAPYTRLQRFKPHLPSKHVRNWEMKKKKKNLEILSWVSFVVRHTLTEPALITSSKMRQYWSNAEAHWDGWCHKTCRSLSKSNKRKVPCKCTMHIQISSNHVPSLQDKY